MLSDVAFERASEPDAVFCGFVPSRAVPEDRELSDIRPWKDPKWLWASYSTRGAARDIGSIFLAPSREQFDAALANTLSDPESPHLGCTAYMISVRAEIARLVVAARARGLTINGGPEPIVQIADNGSGAASVFWRGSRYPGVYGTVAFLDGSGVTDTQCAPDREEVNCLGCRALAHAARQRLAPDPTARTHVYFIRAGDDGPIKIGFSANVTSRLATFRTASHERLTLLATVPGGAELEAALHARFAAHRKQGEWFAPARGILDLIAELKG